MGTTSYRAHWRITVLPGESFVSHDQIVHNKERAIRLLKRKIRRANVEYVALFEQKETKLLESRTIEDF